MQRSFLYCLLPLAYCLLAGCGATADNQRLGPNRVAYVGADGLLYTMRPDGSNVVGMTTGAPASGGRRVENWPTWSPDGRWLAFTRTELAGDAAAKAGVFVVSADAQREIRLPVPDRSGPIYMSWAPDSRYLTLLLQVDQGLILNVADMHADPPTVRHVDSGAPLFTSWSPDSSMLTIHVDGDRRTVGRARLSQANLHVTDDLEVLPLQPGSFATPAWSPDGSQWAFAAAVNDTDDGLYLRHSQESTLVAQGVTPAFVWAPTGNRLGFAVRENPDDDFYAGLSIADGSGKTAQILTEPVVAFFWSPDGKRLAYFTPAGDGLTLISVDASGGDKHQLATFSPTQEYAQLLSFFDQYAQSHSIWSPDSRQVLLAGIRTTGNGASNPNTPHIYAAMADGSAVTSLVDGRIGFWSLLPR